MVKYYLSLCCIIKDETYLEEFIIYYRILGVEHFYIYDNESNIPIKKRLSHDFFKDICTIFDFPGKIQQLNAYNHCINNFKHDTEWLIVVDGDEYILPKKDNHFSIRDFLNEYEDAHAIGINWVMFGSSYYNEKQNGYLVDKYRFCENKQNHHIKTIFKPRFAYEYKHDPHHLNVHNPSKYIDSKRNIISNTLPFNNNYTIDIIQINHYSIRSIEDQSEKIKRGFPDQINANYIPSKHLMYNDIVDDFLPNKYLEHIKRLFEEIK